MEQKSDTFTSNRLIRKMTFSIRKLRHMFLTLISLSKTQVYVSLNALLAFTPCFLSGAQIHALLAADTITNIRKSSRHDLSNIKNALSQIEENTKIPVRLFECSDSTLCRDPIDNWISTTKVEPDDIIIFYFTGHGFRTKKSPSVWPSIFLASSGDTVDMHFIIEKLQKLPARLCLVISDCCNNVIRGKMLLVPKTLMPKGSNNSLITKAFRKLFLETEGLIIASGSVPGELAWATDQGGIFTNSLLQSIEREAQKPDPKWERIFSRSISLCGGLQRPQFYSDIRHIKRQESLQRMTPNHIVTATAGN